MAVQMWMRDDIYNVLMGLAAANAATPSVGSPHVTAFRQGYRAALVAVALTFGISQRTLGFDCDKPITGLDQNGETR